VPVLSVPFIVLLASWHRRADRTPGIERLPLHSPVFVQVFHEYDLIGVCLLVAAIALILVPLTLAKGVASSWDGSNIAMICCGFVCLILFVIW